MDFSLRRALAADTERKQTMQKDPQSSKLLTAVNAAGEAVLMNLAFLVCCIPVVTIGQAWGALYGAIRSRARGDGWFSGFRAGLCAHFLRGVIGWTVSLALAAYLGFSAYSILFYRQSGFLPPFLVSAVLFLAVILWQTAAAALNARVDGGVGDWMAAARRLCLRAPLQVLGAAVLMWLPVALALFWTDLAFHALLIFLAVYFTLAALAALLLLKSALRRLTPEREGADE